jgi:hypothetical protein
MRLFSLILLSLLPACRREAAFTFEDPGRSLGMRTADPVALVRPSGHIAGLTTESAGDGNDLVVHHSQDGDGYRRGERVNEVAGEVASRAEATPQLLAGPGMRLCALWLARPASGEGGLRLRCSRDFGERWQPAVEVPAGPGRPPSFFAGAVSPSGAMVVTWFVHEASGLPGSAQLWLASSADGVTFTPGRRIALDVCPCCRPVLAAGQGALFLAYRAVDAESYRDVVLRRSGDDGTTWSDPVYVSRDKWQIDGCPHSGPALVVSKDHLAVAWLTVAESRARLFWAESHDGGRSFTPREPLGSGLPDPNHPSLAILDGKLVAAYEARDPAEGNTWGARRAWLEDLESRTRRAIPSSGGASYPRLAALSAGAVLVTWTGRESEGTQARFSRVRILQER